MSLYKQKELTFNLILFYIYILWLNYFLGNCDLFGDCFSPQSYLNWTDTGIITYRFEEIAGVGQEIFYLMLPGIFYIILIILIEYGIIKIVLGFICKQQKQNFPMNATDDEVIAEKQRIQELVQQRMQYK